MNADLDGLQMARNSGVALLATYSTACGNLSRKEGGKTMAEPAKAVPLGTFPASNFPVTFADGVLSIANSATTVKFYLFRFDPEFAGGGQSQSQPTVQVVMPIEGFASAFVFFETAIKRYISQGLLTEARVDEFRRGLENVEWRT
jgi:hypothetical protein